MEAYAELSTLVCDHLPKINREDEGGDRRCLRKCLRYALCKQVGEKKRFTYAGYRSAVHPVQVLANVELERTAPCNVKSKP